MQPTRTKEVNLGQVLELVVSLQGKVRSLEGEMELLKNENELLKKRAGVIQPSDILGNTFWFYCGGCSVKIKMLSGGKIKRISGVKSSSLLDYVENWNITNENVLEFLYREEITDFSPYKELVNSERRIVFFAAFEVDCMMTFVGSHVVTGDVFVLRKSEEDIFRKEDEEVEGENEFKRNPSILLTQIQAEELSRITKPTFDSETWNLLHRASRDGFSHSIFHRNCDDHEPTLVVIQSEQGNVFGGYNPVKWNIIKDGYYKAPGVFIFGFEQNQTKIVKIDWNGKGYGSIYCGRGPCFSSDTIYIREGICVANGGNLGGSWNRLYDSSFVYGGQTAAGYPLPKEKEKSDRNFLNGGTEHFKVLDYEVFTTKKKT